MNGTDDAMTSRPLRDPRILILDTSIRILYPSILVLALYFVFAGHNRPGGGFVGGLVVGAALALRYVSGGAAAVRSTFRVPPHVILGARAVHVGVHGAAARAARGSDPRTR